MDVFSPAKRSDIMSRIRSRDTAPERQLHELVRDVLGGRWRIHLNAPGLPGKPDIVVPGLRLAIFVHGCFFHGCSAHSRPPRSNRGYWIPKIEANGKRHRVHCRRLRALGYSVWTCWEHDLKPARIGTTREAFLPRLAALRDAARGRRG
jgi:DNA mismatch endonuclease (patch repair protein)